MQAKSKVVRVWHSPCQKKDLEGNLGFQKSKKVPQNGKDDFLKKNLTSSKLPSLDLHGNLGFQKSKKVIF